MSSSIKKGGAFVVEATPEAQLSKDRNHIISSGLPEEQHLKKHPLKTKSTFTKRWPIL
jgi:hypothetical protein